MNEFQSDGIYREQTADLYDVISTGLEGDVAFYLEEAKRAGSTVLELGCGTGRILIPIAAAGVEVIGLDASERMLSIAQQKVAALERETQNRIRLVEQDMRSFDFGCRFSLIMIPYRAFLHLLTVEDQKETLACIRAHLIEGGRLVFNVFDPRMETIAAHSGPFGTAIKKLMEFTDPRTGRRTVAWESRKYDCVRQVPVEDRILEVLDESGQVISRNYATLTLRYNTRFEMQHLLNLCGFEVEALFGDFARGPFRYGGEQVWIARPTCSK